MSTTFFSTSIAKDAAYSNLYGGRINGETVVADRAIHNSLTIGAGDIKDVTATTINGSSVNISLINCQPNELLATNAQTTFVSIPYTTNATANSVPKRTAADYTSFAQLTLTDTTNQIIANASPNQTTVSAPAPSAARVYSLQFEGDSGNNTQMLSVFSSSDGIIAANDPSITNTQIGLKTASNGTARFNIDSFVANDSFLSYYFGGSPAWTLGNSFGDDHFSFNCNDVGVEFWSILTDTTIIGDVVPLSTGLALGSSSKRWNALCLTPGSDTNTDIVTFTGTNIVTFRTINVSNSTVTTASCIICAVYDFDGTYFANGSPYALITNIVNGSFDLNVWNADSSHTISNTRTILVRYWVLS